MMPEPLTAATITKGYRGKYAGILLAPGHGVGNWNASKGFDNQFIMGILLATRAVRDADPTSRIEMGNPGKNVYDGKSQFGIQTIVALQRKKAK